MSAQPGHLPIDALLQDWLGESEPAARAAVDEHLMECDACGALFDGIFALGTGVRESMQAGAVGTMAGPGFVERLLASGVRVRQYRLPHNGSVHCTVAPDDQVLVSRLQAPLHDVQRLDIARELSIAPGVLHRAEDVPFDPAAGEVLLLPGIARVRQLPAHTMQVTLLAVDASGSREIGRYVFHHSPWSG